MVHHILEGGRCIRQSEWYDLEFEEAIVGSERCFPFVAFSNSDEVKPVFEVHFREPLGPLNSVL